jgi:hypothetical protein
MRFDWTIDLGGVITMLSAVGAVLYSLFKIGAQINAMSIKVDMIWDWFVEHRGKANGNYGGIRSEKVTILDDLND